MYISWRSVPLKSIIFTSSWNLHPWELELIPEKLLASFKQTGVLHPPIVVEEPDNIFSIITGYKRLYYLENHSTQEEIDCIIIDKRSPFLYILDVILTDQNLGGHLSLAEKSRFIEIASRKLSEEEIFVKYYNKLQLKKRRSSISDLLNILKQDNSFIKEVHNGRLQEKMVAEIIKLPKEGDRLILVNLFKDLSLGDSKQRRFFSMIRDITLKSEVSISDYVESYEIKDILGHSEMNVPQKIHHLSIFLQQQLTPRSTHAKKTFIEQIKNLKLPSTHSISHSPSFEKEEVTLSIKFANLSECKRYLGNN